MRRRSVLIVEDDDDLRGLFRTALALGGFDVREAANGLEALKRVDSEPPDVIILDMMLPTISGFGVLYDLAAQPHTRNIPVVVVTGSPETPDPGRVACILRKPITADDLIAAIERCLGAGAQPQF